MSLNTVKMDSPGKSVFMLGNEVIARGALEAGVSVVSCYPGTPSSEIADTLAGVSKDFGFVMEYSANEKVALEVAGSVAIAGGRSMAIMKHVGLNVASDAFFSLAYMGFSGAMVIVVCDDPFLFSSQSEEDTRLIARCAYVPVLEPSNAKEAKDMVREAFDISQRFGTPVMLRPTTRISHSNAVVELGVLAQKKRENITWDLEKKWWQQHIVVPAIARPNRLKMIERTKKIKDFFEKIQINSFIDKGSEIGILTSGVSHSYVLESIDTLGYQISIMKIGTSFPLPSDKITDFLKGIKKLIVVEEGEPYLEMHAKSLAFDAKLDLDIYGKENGFFPLPYEYNVPIVIKGICNALGIKVPVDYEGIEKKASAAKDLAPKRPPTFCPGCPHTATFYALRRATKGEVAFSGDIGCYSLGFLPPFSGIDLMLCMGGSVGMASGLQYVIDKPVVALIGDSTFFHSGLSPLVSAVYNQANFTLFILDNSATAMTGLQPHPGTGELAGGKQGKRLSIEEIVRGIGVEDIKVVNQFQIKDAIKVFKSSIEYKGVSVVICRQPCVLITKGRYKKEGKRFALYYIDEEKCDGCFICSKKLGCPAIIQNTEVAQILPESCVGCGVCAQICPHDAIEKREEK